MIKEARNGLEQAKDAIIEFIASQWNHEHLARVPELLTQVWWPGDDPAATRCRPAQCLQSLHSGTAAGAQGRAQLAEPGHPGRCHHQRRVLPRAAVREYGTQGDLILDVAEESLETLGYPLKEKPSILDRVEPQEETLAPLADPLQEIELLGAEDEQLEEPLAETEALTFDVVEPSSDEVADLQLLDAEPEQSDARETADSFTFELDELEELPALQDEETVAAPLLDAEPELELEELNLDQLAEPAQWDELELADLELPEVELPSAPQVQELPDEPAAEKPLSMADVMAAPVQAINPTCCRRAAEPAAAACRRRAGGRRAAGSLYRRSRRSAGNHRRIPAAVAGRYR